MQRLHMTMDKQYLIGLIKQYGAKEVLTDFTGTNEEAIQTVMDDPREAFPAGKCDHQDEKGYCLGHKHACGTADRPG